jgi:hypothetical protein
MKKWLSRGIVLAMIIALMVPMPVAAKSSKGGGKLVKSVTEYEVTSAGAFRAESKTTYTYDKKNNPKEIKTLNYYRYLFGVPVGGSYSITTAKFKYKGKKVKSAQFMNEAGVVMTQSSYKNGKPVMSTYSEAASYNDGTASAWAEQYVTTTAKDYDKNGLTTARTYSWSNQESGSDPYSGYGITTVSYAWAQKKGIPSLVYTTYSSSSNGGAASEPWMNYTVFDGNGLAVDIGYMDNNNTVPKSEYKVTYSMKKGNVDQAIVWDSVTGKAVRMYEFKYYKTKISKTRYMSMINAIVGYCEGSFSWF